MTEHLESYMISTLFSRDSNVTNVPLQDIGVPTSSLLVVS